MHRSKFWSTLDAASAYWSMPLQEEDKEKTAFSVPRGKYEFNVTPYGLCNAGASYQRMIDVTLAGLPPKLALAYMDDTAVFTRTFKEHLRSLEMVLTCMRASNISLRLKKCVFASASVDFLGYELSRNGIAPQRRLIESIATFPEPTTKKEVKRFLGMAGFYRAFIPGFSKCHHMPYPIHTRSENIRIASSFTSSAR